MNPHGPRPRLKTLTMSHCVDIELKTVRFQDHRERPREMTKKAYPFYTLRSCWYIFSLKQYIFNLLLHQAGGIFTGFDLALTQLFIIFLNHFH